MAIYRLLYEPLLSYRPGRADDCLGRACWC